MDGSADELMAAAEKLQSLNSKTNQNQTEDIATGGGGGDGLGSLIVVAELSSQGGDGEHIDIDQVQRNEEYPASKGLDYLPESPPSSESNGDNAATKNTENEKLPSPVKEGQGMVKFTGNFVMKNVTLDKAKPDCRMVCSNGSLGAHRIVLAAASPFMAHILKDHRLGEFAVINVIDYTVELMQQVLHFCYTGRVNFRKSEQEELSKALVYLRIGEHAKEFSFGPTKDDPSDANNASETPIEQNPNTAEPQPSTSSTSANALKEDRKRNNEDDCDSTVDVDEEEGSSEDKDPEEEEEKQLSESIKKAWDPKKKLPALGIIVNNGLYECCVCNKTLGKKVSLIKHLGSHKKEFSSLSQPPKNELKEMSKCALCGEQHTSVSKSSACLLTHGYQTCLVCLATLPALPAKEFIEHYRNAHGIPTVHGLVTKCRWCDLAFPISGNALGLKRHVLSTHIPHSSKDVLSPPPTKLNKAEIKKSVGRSGQNTVLNYFQRFKDNMKEEGEPEEAGGSSGSPTSTNNPMKKRRLDDDGRPLQLAKRTGIPMCQLPGMPRCLSSKMKFQMGVYELTLDPESGKLQNLIVEDLPGIKVHLHALSKEEVESHLNPSRLLAQDPMNGNGELCVLEIVADSKVDEELSVPTEGFEMIQKDASLPLSLNVNVDVMEITDESDNKVDEDKQINENENGVDSSQKVDAIQGTSEADTQVCQSDEGIHDDNRLENPIVITTPAEIETQITLFDINEMMEVDDPALQNEQIKD